MARKGAVTSTSTGLREESLTLTGKVVIRELTRYLRSTKGGLSASARMAIQQLSHALSLPPSSKRRRAGQDTRTSGVRATSKTSAWPQSKPASKRSKRKAGDTAPSARSQTSKASTRTRSSARPQPRQDTKPPARSAASATAASQDPYEDGFGVI